MNSGICATGSCNCGAVAFAVKVPLHSVFICHCSICRKSTGSGGIAVTIVPKQALHFIGNTEQIKKWEKPNHDWLTQFCNSCGSPLPGKNDENTYYIPVSLLDSGYENLEVKHHLFVDSKANWEEIGMMGKQHKEAFEK
ncbi:GFA family protein [Bowmanella sp. Y26]|uniref:GFA family protein n=1 Tax=Bowmanella yangjiangensis TaxID=2811230 RepID=UPI001BDD7CF7|nr:GFA family protein [Bowmanella yangjiangensis]MBT1065086.1 GFA family protein [Bowmanella yangjiangensis]